MPLKSPESINQRYEEFNSSQLLEKAQEVIGREARVSLSDGKQFGIHKIYSVREDGVLFVSNHESTAVKFFVPMDQIENIAVRL